MRFFILLFFYFHILPAQKVVKKAIVNHEITSINIDVTNCYKLVLDTTAYNEMVLEATIDGEYKKDLVLNSEQKGHTIHVSNGFQPIFKNPNDKLSAHKVISIALKINIPKNKSVMVYGSDCNVTVAGNYRKIKIILDDGICILNNVSKSVTVMTRSGDISAYTRGAEVIANSKYGSVLSDKIPAKNDHYVLTTITGNISIRKTE